MRDGTRADELDGIEWFARLCGRWFWIPLALGVAGWFVGSLMSEPAPTSRQVRIELGLSDAAVWPFPDSVMPRAIAAVESGRVAEDLGLDPASISVEPGEGLAPMTVLVGADDEETATQRAELVADYLVEDSREARALEERTALAASEAAVEREDTAIDEATDALGPIESRIDEIDEAISDGDAGEELRAEQRGLIVDRDRLAAERRARIDARATAIVDVGEFEAAIESTAPMLESYGVVELPLTSGSGPWPLSTALVGAVVGVLALPMFDDRRGSLRTPASVRRVLGDVPILDLTNSGGESERHIVATAWADGAENAALIGAGSGASLDAAAEALGDAIDEIALLEELDDAAVRTLTSADLVLLVAPTKSLSPVELRSFSRRLDLLGVEPKAIALTAPATA